MPENKYLAWIKKYKEILSIRKLEEFIRIPTQSLQIYLAGDRDFPSKHIRKLEKKMEMIIKLDNPFILMYVAELCSEYYARQKQVSTAPDLQKRDWVNAQREQIIEDILRVYLIAVKTNPSMEEDVFSEIRGIDPYLMDSIREIVLQPAPEDQEQLTLPKIRRMLGIRESVSQVHNTLPTGKK